MDITTATPTEIDTMLADIYTSRGAALASLDGAKRGIYRELGNFTSARTPITLTDEDLATFRTRITEDKNFSYRHNHYLVAFDKATETLAALRVEEAPLNAEYLRRPWSRFFIVPGGHIHSSMNCSTCNKNGKATQFGWLPELSGQTEAEAVAEHQAILCTNCFASAPLAWTNFYEKEAERKAAEYCTGSGTFDWKDGNVRTGFYSGNGGYCSHCGGWAGTTSKTNNAIRKHKPAKA